MDFIELWFHVSPDGGSGAVEMLFVIGLPILVALVFRRGYFLSLFRHFEGWLGKREN